MHPKVLTTTNCLWLDGWLDGWLVGWLGVKLMMRIISDSIPTRGSEVRCQREEVSSGQMEGVEGGKRGRGGLRVGAWGGLLVRLLQPN